MSKKPTGNEIEQNLIDFLVEHGHTAVPSMSLVPGGDATLLYQFGHGAIQGCVRRNRYTSLQARCQLRRSVPRGRQAQRS